MSHFLSFTLHYAESSKFRLTEFGWGFFLQADLEVRKTFGPSFNLPVTLSELGQVVRVHLWKPEVKGMCLIVHSGNLPKGALIVPVQYSAGGGTYTVNTLAKVPLFTGKEFIVNGFADTVTQDLPGFV